MSIKDPQMSFMSDKSCNQLWPSCNPIHIVRRLTVRVQSRSCDPDKRLVGVQDPEMTEQIS